MYYTYAHTKPDGTIFYIGKGQGRRAWDNKSRNRHWGFVVAKHNDYEVTILSEHETEKEAMFEETELISHFKKFGFLTNMTDGGEGASGYKHTEEQLEKRRGEKNGMFGRTRTEEEVNKISEQTRKKMAEKGFTHKITVGGKEFNSKRELARVLKVHHKTIQTWINRGTLEERYRANIH